MRRAGLAAGVALLTLPSAACGGAGPADGSGDGRPGPVRGEVVVFAASSLTGPFRRIGDAFEAAYPGAQVRFSFGGSSTLGPQVAARAPADVFASADRATMERAVAARATARPPVVFAYNRLQIAVPAGNPGAVEGLDDFGRSGLTLAVCAPEVPCGAAARRAFAAARVRARPDTLEQDVKAVLTKVRLGEVDAGLVYRTDVRAAGPRVRGVAVPEARQVVNTYPIAPLAEAPNPTAARAFVRFVRSGTGREVLARAGFGLP